MFIAFGCAEKPETNTADNTTIQIDSITEKTYGYIKKVETSNTDLYITVDAVDYLTGEEATEAEWDEKAYFIDREDTITTITDGYYISNPNKDLTTYKIAKNAKIENIIDDSGAHKMEVIKELNVDQLNAYRTSYTLLFITVEKGIVRQIDEQFMP